ncbi:hypothetical protein MKX03_027246 [Papaver bracteatum]|nr:hypothetical protein MKX03_027246 [Papaver bracteatum]
MVHVHQLYGLDAAVGFKHQVVSKSDRLYMARSAGELLGMLPGPAVYVNFARRNSSNLHMLEFASDVSSIPVNVQTVLT